MRSTIAAKMKKRPGTAAPAAMVVVRSLEDGLEAVRGCKREMRTGEGEHEIRTRRGLWTSELQRMADETGCTRDFIALRGLTSASPHPAPPSIYVTGHSTPWQAPVADLTGTVCGSWPPCSHHPRQLHNAHVDHTWPSADTPMSAHLVFSAPHCLSCGMRCRPWP